MPVTLGAHLPVLDSGPPETPAHPCPSPYYMNLLAVGCLTSCPRDWAHPVWGKAAPVCCAWLSPVDVRIGLWQRCCPALGDELMNELQPHHVLLPCTAGAISDGSKAV